VTRDIIIDKTIPLQAWTGPEGSVKFNNNNKAIPLEAWTGPEGSRRLRLPDFRTYGA
jgi:hypothetical protein